jgi:hypothetical protein
VTAVETADVARSRNTAILAVFAAGASVSVALGVYGRVHDATGRKIVTLGFSSMPSMKIWLGTIAVVLAVLQLLSALWMFGKLPTDRPAPAWIPPAHRWLGTAAFVATVPVAYHCLWSIGFGNQLGNDSEDTRRLIHSVAGCIFYGAFTTKMLSLRIRNLPRWTVPVVGGLVFGALVIVWFTSSLWWFRYVEFPDF